MTQAHQERMRVLQLKLVDLESQAKQLGEQEQAFLAVSLTFDFFVNFIIFLFQARDAASAKKSKK